MSTTEVKYNKSFGEQITMRFLDSSKYTDFILDSLNSAQKQESNLDEWALTLEGMSGFLYRHFINNLSHKLEDRMNYLEVGSWKGSTAVSCGFGNNDIDMCLIDNWSEFGGPEDEFRENINKMRLSGDSELPENKVRIHSEDFRTVKLPDDIKYNVYLFDGPHEFEDQRDGLELMLPFLEDEFIFIVDDWNWDRVKQGTTAAINNSKLNVKFFTTIETNQCPDSNGGSRSAWHNGYFIGVISK